jgi:CRP-like cAMP-binding protein
MKTRTQNSLLNLLNDGDYENLAADLTQVRLDSRRALEAPNQEIEDIFFPESGIISVVAKATGDRRIETGLIGKEGMTGLAVVLGDRRSPNEVFAQVDADALRAPVGAIRDLMQRSDSARGLFLRYVNVFMVQTAHTALANGHAKIEERLARWLARRMTGSMATRFR